MELYLEPKIIKRDERGRFVKGHKPFNKGTKGLMKANRTSFKSGHIPHNTKNNGAISYRTHKRDGRTYKYIRTAKAKWELYHRYLWRQYYGEIPQGYVIRFIDGDTMNTNINNLECISRAENRNRNINYEKSAKTIKETWRKEWLRQIYGLPVKTKLLKRCKRISV
ncbi:MAG: HNH endonuclease [Bacteroidales bacterium]|nr:HNH endonuclease [Bacteroidales bacterium]